MIVFKYENVEIGFKPLENGKCEYKVDVHDFDSLEGVVDRILTYDQLQELLDNPQDCIKLMRYHF